MKKNASWDSQTPINLEKCFIAWVKIPLKKIMKSSKIIILQILNYYYIVHKTRWTWLAIKIKRIEIEFKIKAKNNTN